MKVSWKAKEVTNKLKELAVEAESMTPDGTPITRAHALALLIWKRALGYSEVKKTKDGVEEVVHPSEVWAISMVLDRLEGKIPTATNPEEAARPSAAARVSDLAKSRINALASDAPSSGPPKRKS